MVDTRRFDIQLQDQATGENIITAGGRVIVCAVGTAQRLALLTNHGEVMQNPFTPIRGKIEFNVAEDITHVDLYILSPNGEFAVRKGVWSSGPNEIEMESGVKHNVMVIPVSYRDGAAERDTGLVFPARSLVTAGSFIDVRAADAGVTVTAGTLSTAAGGDADAIAAAVSVANAGVVAAPTVTNSAALGGRAVSTTVSAGADTVEAFIHIPYLLAA